MSRKMEKQERKGARHNAGLVDALFEMMFETLWTSPSTRWRNVEAFRSFEECARRVVVLLSATNLASADAERLAQIGSATDDLSRSVAELTRNKLIPRAGAAHSAELIRQLEDAVSAGAAEIPSR